MPQIAEHRLNRGKALAIEGPASFRINRPPHDLGVAHFRRVGLAAKEAHLTSPGFLRRAQATLALGAGHAVALGALEFHGNETVVNAVRPVLVPTGIRLPSAPHLGL